MGMWLVRALVGNVDKDAATHDLATRTRLGLLASITCIVLNVTLCLAKGTVGLVVGSVSIVADAINNLSDAASNIVSLLAFKLASRPADTEHPYGHGRFEYLAALAVAVVVCAIGIDLVGTSIDRIVNPVPIDFGPAIVIVLVGSIVVKLWMAGFNRTVGRLISSEVLAATAADSRADVLTSAAILIAMAIAHLTSLHLDGWIGLVAGLCICVGGIRLVHDAVDPLLGRAPDPERVERIRQRVLSYPGVLGTHDLMIHDYGPGRQFASTHVEMAGEGDPFEQHEIIDTIEQDFLRDEGLVMTIHLDPIVTNDPHQHDMRNWINEAVRNIDPGLSIHDLRWVPGPTQTTVIFDCVRPKGMAMSDDELRRHISALVVERYPRCVCKITIDTGYISSEP